MFGCISKAVHLLVVVCQVSPFRQGFSGWHVIARCCSSGSGYVSLACCYFCYLCWFELHAMPGQTFSKHNISMACCVLFVVSTWHWIICHIVLQKPGTWIYDSCVAFRHNIMLLYRQDLTKNKMAANGMKETILRFNDLSYSPAMANYSLPLVGCI